MVSVANIIKLALEFEKKANDVDMLRGMFPETKKEVTKACYMAADALTNLSRFQVDSENPGFYSKLEDIKKNMHRVIVGLSHLHF